MTKAVRFYYNYFGFTGSCSFVEYGEPSIPSWSYWLVPGSGESL